MNRDELRGRLRNLRTRSATIDAAVDSGAVDVVVPLLQDRNEGVRWSAIRILGELGDERAVLPLIDLLEQRKNESDVARALQEITRHEGEDTPEAWRQWVAQSMELSAGDSAWALSDEELVKQAADGLPISISGGDESYALAVTLPEGRSQHIWVDFSQRDADGRPLVQLCTPCGRVDPARYESVLKLNMSIPYGAIAVAELEGELCFAVVDTYLRATAHPEDIATSVMSLAHHGDSIEAQISDEDRW